ncbi:MFS transporter [Lacrimispora saccharolytica]|uniref:Major facilitator superfamily MFS_1 n=1 Tax=Lacrimispora saccharolytica (strain ATCC 35040 / DSM 2544 / NRCC 2533 / WM1) TaxID=610130 RepID=D9R4A1_LACSW|nr:MFS transporter [Lacrimispora saccharolytica]ADL04971.1 major facilitator superfamily MFS_1 [[Clostridium] saccharolyticum WM1]QRV20826.1 MFS transporter [Lacrimispora saccharolytica]
MDRIVQQKKIRSEKNQTMLFWLCWAAYFSTYLGRLNYSASLTEIIRAEGYEKGAAGLIGTAFFFSYGLGQLFSGILGDRKKPYKMILIGVLGSGICNGAMGLSSSVRQMAAVWCINGLLQSLIWSPIIKLFSDWIPAGSQKKFCVNINSSVPIGTFAAYGLTALLIWKFHWRTVFFFSALCLTAISVIWYLGSHKIMRDVEENGILEEPVFVSQEKKQADVSMRNLVLGSGMIFFCFGLMFQGVLKDGVTTWIPTYIREEYHMESVISIISTTIIPVFNLSGVYMASIANRKVFKSEITTSASFFALCAGALVLLRLYQGGSVLVVLLLFGMATTAMMAVNTMLVSMVPLYFAPYGKSSTASGILNSSAYAGGAVSAYGIGVLSEWLGWDATILIWIIIAVLGAWVCTAGIARWKRFLQYGI